MGEETVRWTIVVDKATDIKLRTRLAERGLKKGDLSKFVEEAVKRQLFAETRAEIQGFADLSPEEVEELFDDAVTWARKG